MTSRLVPAVGAALLLLTGTGCTGCSARDTGAPAARALPAAPVPQAAGQLEALLVTDVPSGLPRVPDAELERLLVQEVPSGLPRVPDDELDPPAGEKTIDDVARYGEDAAEQRAVLADYGYQRGWERFWRSGNALTSVFIDQFSDPDGAGSYAEDLARNDAEYYDGELDSAPSDLPDGCVLMPRDEPAPDRGLAGPAAFAWCASGVFTVAVAAMAATPADARAELVAVTAAQLDRLPG